MFIIDFDDTLFDTHAFKEARRNALLQVGISDKLFWQTYAEARSGSDGAFVYSDQRHAAMLALQGADEAAVLAALRRTSEPAMVKTFLFPDTIQFLTGLRRLKQPMILLSLGDPEFQELKVKGAGIDQYFDRLYMIKEKKAQVIEHLLRDVHSPSVVWLVNDKIDEAEALVHRFPILRPVIRPSRSVGVAACRASGYACFSTLREILLYVKP